MRKQYHFRESERGLLAWDVDRLIELAKGIEPSAVPLSEIKEIDEPYWYRDGRRSPSCRDLVAHMQLVTATDLRYPIILSPDGRIMDGMHRVAKALLQGEPTIKATRLQMMPKPDFVDVDPADLPYEDT
jgi:hypothetical protein